MRPTRSRARSRTAVRSRRRRRGSSARFGWRGDEVPMIARLGGTLLERDTPHVVVDCHGVGYDVIVSAYTLASLPADGARVKQRIFTHATETKLSLFGFIEAQERALFDLLI